jgi:hypothetical protein
MENKVRNKIRKKVQTTDASYRGTVWKKLSLFYDI